MTAAKGNSQAQSPSQAQSQARAIGAAAQAAKAGKISPGAQELARLIEVDVIPRMLMSYRPNGAAAPSPAAEVAPDIDAFIAELCAEEMSAALAYVEHLRAAGVTLTALYRDVLAPAARRLGELWEADLLAFAEVTIALGRLHRMVHTLAAAPGEAAPSGVRRALLAACPGEQHTFGLLLVTETFRRAGWQVWSEPSATRRDLVELVGQDWFDVVGLTATCDESIERLATLVLALRRASRNPRLLVLVGGARFLAQPDLAHKLGADGTAQDGEQALRAVESFLELAARPD